MTLESENMTDDGSMGFRTIFLLSHLTAVIYQGRQLQCHLIYHCLGQKIQTECE